MTMMQQSDPFAEFIQSGSVRTTDMPQPMFALGTRMLRPTTAEALAALVARANETQTPFTFAGGTTAIASTPGPYLRSRGAEGRHAAGRLAEGRLAEVRVSDAHNTANAPQPDEDSDSRSACVFSLELLNGVIEYRPMDYTITVEAGMRVAHLRDMLATRGQTLTLDTAFSARATIGGLLASGRTGPRRRALGCLRDALLGARLVQADGTLIESGVQTLRHSGGYDLARLYAGSYGMLGAYASVTLRTRPLPEARRCTVATLPRGTRERTVRSLELLPVEPVASLLLDGFERTLPGAAGPDGRLYLFFEGNDAVIQRATRDLRTLFGAIGISETRIFDRESDAIIEKLLEAPQLSGSPDSVAAIRLQGGAMREACSLRERVLDLTHGTGVLTELVSDLQNDEVLARVQASGPRALEISTREVFIALARESESSQLLVAPLGLRERFNASIASTSSTADPIQKILAP